MAGGGGSPARYRFGPLERRGVVAGWRGGQIAAVATGLVVAVGALRSLSSVVGIGMALSAVVVAMGTATWPVGGRTAEQWAPDAARHATVVAGRRRPGGRSAFAGVRIVRVEIGPTGAVGVLHDRRRRTYTAVLAASAPGFVLLGDDDKARRVADWAGVLAAMARDGSAVHRLQWIERVVPDTMRRVAPPPAPLTNVFPAPDGVAGRSGDAVGYEAACASYDALLAAEGGTAWRHDVHLALTVRADRAARAVKAAGGGDAGACAVLLREVAALRRRLTDASVDVGGVLDPVDVAALVRAIYQPDTAVPSAASSSSEVWPWPMGAWPEWARLRADAGWLATFWVAEWPRIDVGPDFLAPFVLPSDVRRTLSVVMEPLGPLAAARKAEQARTADIADAEIRRRGGFLATARRRREEEVAVRRELELADGHAQYRFSGYVTIRADDPDALEDACRRTEQSAGRAAIELRRCYGDQLNAFLCTLPLGRGLP